MRQIIDIIINQETASRVVVVGNSFQPPDSSQLIRLFYGTQVLFRASIYSKSPTNAFPIPETAAFIFGIDDIPFSDNEDCVISQNDKFNITEDWDEINLSQGKICFRVNLSTTTLKTALQSKTSNEATFYANLWMLTTAGNVILASFPVVISKIFIDPNDPVNPETIQYATMDAVNANFIPRFPQNSNWRFKNASFQYKFEDGAWRTIAFSLGDNNTPVLRFGEPEYE